LALSRPNTLKTMADDPVETQQAELFAEQGQETAPEVTEKPKPAPDKALETRVAAAEQTARDMAARFQALQQAVAQPQAPRPQDQAALQQQLTDQIWQDPTKLLTLNDFAMQRRLAEFAQQQAAQNFPRDREMAIESARRAEPMVFQMYEAEVADFVRQRYEPHQTNPEVWKIAAKAVKGEHAQEITDAMRRAKQNGGPAAPSLRGQPAAPSKDSLDDEEKLVAADIFGISEDRYKAGRKFYDEQRSKSDRTGRKILQSAWAKARVVRNGMEVPLMTFDSDVQRPRPVEK